MLENGTGPGTVRARPYDRIIVTTGTRRLEDEWIAQLADGGVLVSPLVDQTRGGLRTTWR